MTTMLTQITPINELPEVVRAMAHGYCEGDHARAMAVMLSVFEDRSVRSIEATTGVPRTTVQRLAKGFRKVCQDWHDRRTEHLRTTGDHEH